MANTPTLDEARSAGQDALERVATAAGSEWLEEAITFVKLTCQTKRTLICDDVWAMGLRSIGRDRAFGQAMKVGVANGWMRRTGEMRPSKRSHGSPKPVYQSLIYGAALPGAPRG